MISRRIFVTTIAIVSILLAGNAAMTFLLDVGHVSTDEQIVSTVKLSSPALRLPGRPAPTSLMWSGTARSLIYDWKDRETQTALGPITVTVLTSNKPVREWLRAGLVCDFLFEHAGASDHFTAAPDGDALTMKNMHVCKAVSLDDQREWYYAYAMPDQRCHRNALVYWRMPWKVSDDTPDADDVNRRLDSGMQARGFNAIRGSIMPSPGCGEDVASFARSTVVASMVGACSLALLFILLYRRSGV